MGKKPSSQIQERNGMPIPNICLQETRILPRKAQKLSSSLQVPNRPCDRQAATFSQMPNLAKKREQARLARQHPMTNQERIMSNGPSGVNSMTVAKQSANGFNTAKFGRPAPDA